MAGARRYSVWWGRALVLVFFLTLPVTVKAQSVSGERTFMDRLEYVRHTLEDARYHIWGASAIQGPEGRTHLFVARWPRESTHSGRHVTSEIARYVGADPEGPFQFAEVVLRGSGKEGWWDKRASHNPHIKKVGNRYALFFIENEGREDSLANQHIGLAVADSLTGDFERVGETGRILSPPTDSDHWAHNSPVGVNNPSLLPTKTGQFYLYYEARQDSSQGPVRQMGLAVADRLTGPYTHRANPVTANEQLIENGYAPHEWKSQSFDTREPGSVRRGGRPLVDIRGGEDLRTHHAGLLSASTLPSGS